MQSSETALTKTKNVSNVQPKKSTNVNVGETERVASAIGGAALAIYGLTRGSASGVVLALIGGSLIYRGTTGHCSTYQAMGIDTAQHRAG
ncbi:MAG: DUF2892 domain-containing protein, partial [Pyrinomonadaceae bacterium]|nr:DUF2892 domain-containing protein [Pyrinomonadaceae bacterium]